MFKKILALGAALLGMGLLVGSANPGKADVVSGSTLSGPSQINLYTIITGYKDPQGAVSGYAYFGTADGAWMWANITQVSVQDAHNATVTALGYFMDSIPAVATWTVKDGQISVRITDFTTGWTYENTAPGAVWSGGMQLKTP